MKKTLAKGRFDSRLPFDTVGITEAEYSKVTRQDKEAGTNSNYVRVSFAKRLVELLDNCLLTDTAKKLNIAQASLSDYKSGKAEPKISALAKIAGEFKVSADYLLGMTDTKSVQPDIKSACEYTGLSDEAAKILRKNDIDKTHPLYREIVCFLIESGALNDIVYLLEKSLISVCQYSLLYEDDINDEKTSLLDTQEFQFNKKLTALYSDVISKLGTKLNKKIDTIVSERWQDFLYAAVETKDKMDIIIESLSDDTLLSLQSKTIQEAIKKEAPGMGTS